MTTFETKMKLDGADANYRTQLEAIQDQYKAEKERIIKEFLGDKLAEIGDIVKNEIGMFLKVEERFIDIRYENKTVIIQYKGTCCTEKGKAYKRVKTATRTDYFDLTK